MSYSPSQVKNLLFTIINEMTLKKDEFVEKPGIDFSRTRKFPFEEMITTILTMGGGSIDSELLERFGFTQNTASASAFVQQRSKLKPDAFKHLFRKLVEALKDLKTFEGYRLLAFDGSDIHLSLNPKDSATYYETPGKRGYNLMHLNALYDLQNKIYLDANLKPGKKQSERVALIEMIDRSKIQDKVLILCDRGLEGYNVLGHLEKKGWDYLIRVKDVTSSGIWSGFALPETDCFDVQIERMITKKRTKHVLAHPDIYKRLSPDAPFDFPEGCDFQPLSFRAVRIAFEYGEPQCFITNLPADQFSADNLGDLYHLRWGVETSFRELKHALGLLSFHSKKKAYVTQEVFAKLVMYNFCSTITLNVMIKQPKGKFPYQVNFTRAIQICRKFFKSLAHPLDVEALIQRYILPIRPGRNFPRKVKSRTFVSFLYRVA